MSVKNSAYNLPLVLRSGSDAAVGTQPTQTRSAGTRDALVVGHVVGKFVEDRVETLGPLGHPGYVLERQQVCADEEHDRAGDAETHEVLDLDAEVQASPDVLERSLGEQSAAAAHSG